MTVPRGSGLSCLCKKVGKAIQDGECDKGILICGTGIGISIAAKQDEGNPRKPFVQLLLCRGNQKPVDEAR